MAEVSGVTNALSAQDDMVKGEALATPKARAEQEVQKLLPSATSALRRILELDVGSLDNIAQSAAMKVQLTAAMHVIDGCLGMAAAGSGGTTRNAAKILAAVGGDAVTRELQRRYAMKQRSSERQRIVEAVPAAVSNDDAMQLTAADDVRDDATRESK